MASNSVRGVCRHLLRSRATSRAVCLCPRVLAARRPFTHTALQAAATPESSTSTSTTSPAKPPPAVPLRKQFKDESKKRKASGATKKSNYGQTVPGWELTVGIEIHAQLNTERKLFSPALTSFNDTPNAHVAYFDASLPGAQPLFQPETLIPAIRAALGLQCEIQRVSRFDRKHYFHWDQPSGYQITQYYKPFAKNGYIMLYARDGIALEDGEEIRIDIQQVQMEQDTAKTVAQPGAVHWLDLNRVGVPLIEIITRPQMHHPATAAALVRKIQLLLNAVDACTSGMEAGGLRADVNVSVRREGDAELGTRTEIKNLNSFQAVEDAIIAERNRQIDAIERGTPVQSETRGWAPGPNGGETHRLRSKEGEVDYRYMPDPDLGPVIIDDQLVQYLALTTGALPDVELESLVADYGLTPKDAMALMLLDDGGRAQYYYDVVHAFEERLGETSESQTEHRSFIANWVLHQLGRLTSDRNSGFDNTTSNDLAMTPEGTCRVPVDCLADILLYRYQGRITANVAKELLFAVFRGDIGGEASTCLYPTVKEAIDNDNLWFHEISADEYRELAVQALEGEDKTLKAFVKPNPNPKKYPHGKLQFLLGKLLRLGPEGRTDPVHAEEALKTAIEEYVARVRAG